jgi:glycosyltransferase involved in cell wall biosynthesis
VYKRIEYVSDEDIEVYFKAADVLVLPYTTICQSGVLFLGYQFGVPVVATDVGDLKEYVLQGKTGMICAARRGDELAQSLLEYFAGEMYGRLASTRQAIQRYASETYAWADVAAQTAQVYRFVLAPEPGEQSGSGERDTGAGSEAAG